MSARIHTTTRSSRCWVIGPSAITLKYVEVSFIASCYSLRDIQKEAIQYSWELLIDVFKLPADRLYVTYFEGDPKTGLEPDLEARQYWLDQGVPEDHILPGNAKDNFWGMFRGCLLS